MRSIPTILAIAQDPGGAAALKPVLLALVGRGDIDLRLLGHNQAERIFSEAGLLVVDCQQATLPFGQLYDWANNWLQKNTPNLIITATSGSASLERAFIRAARSNEIKTITVLDSWTNYTSRFLEPGDSQLMADFLPDMITAIDEFSSSEMQAEGFPAEIIRVTGQPALDELLRRSRLPDAWESQQVVRQRYQLAREIPLVVFISQPIAEMYPLGSTTYRGYTEFDVLVDILHVLSLLSQQPFFLVKTHPKAKSSKFGQLLAQSDFPATLVEGIVTEALIQAANLVIGMTSIVLIQSILLGKKVLSYQPNLIGQDALVVSRMGLIKTVNNRAGLEAAVRVALKDNVGLAHTQSALPEIWQDGRAVERICKLVDMSLAG